MASNDAFNLTREIIEQKTVFTKALKHLAPGTEIRVLLEGGSENALFFANGRPQLESRLSPHADVEFVLSYRALENLKSATGDDMGEFGILVAKQIMAGEIKLKVCGKVRHVLTRGYLTIVREAGPSFGKYLAQNGLTHLPKIISVIKKLKK